MTGPESRLPFAAGFMDDYFAEAEEHVVSIERCLLTLESTIGSRVPPGVLEELFRSCHSLKGISGMVELREPEVIAHHMESCLRAIRQSDIVLTSARLETLIDGAKVLEAVLADHRAGRPVPSIERTVKQLEALVGDDHVGAPAPMVLGASATAASTAPRWKVTFVPTAELVARGVNVDSVRSRLLAIATLLSVAPTILPNGSVSFSFEIETDNEEQLAAWRNDGLTYEALSTVPDESALAATPGSTAGADSLVRAPESVPAAATNFVRVDLARLDDLMRLIGDMVVTRSRLEDTFGRIEPHVPFQEWRLLQEHSSRLERQLRDLREGVMRVRLIPVGEIFRRMPFVIRDLARDSGKQVQLVLGGESTEIDKFLIERMMDPVIHLVRNAISHAIETPEQRIAAGKRPEGTIRLSAATSGESVVLEVSDDGAGIDGRAIAQRASLAGMQIPEGPLDAASLLDIICSSGFSTRDEADRASGRGVGMSVVRTTVDALGGQLALSTERGLGTTFTITLPLTLAITDALIVQVGHHTFAIPQSMVREVIEVDAGALRSVERNELFVHRGASLPILRLSELFSVSAPKRMRYHAIVVGEGLGAVGLAVDRVTGQREIVVKTANDPLLRVEGISGATELGDGRLVLILDVLALSQMRGRRRHVVEGMLA